MCAFGVIEQRTNVIVPLARLRAAQGARRDVESWSRLHRFVLCEGCAQVFVDDYLERAAAMAGFGLQARGHIVIKCERRSHVMMLYETHHDV
jgi:hypothetical protein